MQGVAAERTSYGPSGRRDHHQAAAGRSLRLRRRRAKRAPLQPAGASSRENLGRTHGSWHTIPRRDDQYGTDRPMVIEFTRFDRPGRLASSTHVSSMDTHGALTLEPVASGTRMRWSWQLEAHGVLRLMSPMVASMGHRREQRIWTGLKRLLEEEDASSPVSSTGLRAHTRSLCISFCTLRHDRYASSGRGHRSARPVPFKPHVPTR
jgi:hypothetical protein